MWDRLLVIVTHIKWHIFHIRSYEPSQFMTRGHWSSISSIWSHSYDLNRLTILHLPYPPSLLFSLLENCVSVSASGSWCIILLSFLQTWLFFTRILCGDWVTTCAAEVLSVWCSVKGQFVISGFYLRKMNLFLFRALRDDLSQPKLFQTPFDGRLNHPLNNTYPMQGCAANGASSWMLMLAWWRTHSDACKSLVN